jgi:hypothetical protein
MKKTLLVFVLFIASLSSFSQVPVKGYYRSNGTYVKPHQRTLPNSTINDNYSTVGNVNPYTGKAGTVPRESIYNSKISLPSYSNIHYSMPILLTPSYSNSHYSSSSSLLPDPFSSTNSILDSYTLPTVLPSFFFNSNSLFD